MDVAHTSDTLLRANAHHSRLLQRIQGRSFTAESYPIDCEVCMSILRLLETPLWDRGEVLISSEVLVANDFCPNHALLFGSRQDDYLKPRLLRRPAHQQLVHVHPDPYHINGEPACDGAWEYRDLRNDETNASRPRDIDEKWIDLGIIKAWIRECEYEHRGTCDAQISGPNSLPSPLLLVDAEQSCLVYATERVRYVTLSYVWGQTNTFLTTTKNISSLLMSGSLDDPSVVIPQTILQAVCLTSALGERYIWVDALCIVQDAVDRVDYLNAMASLFANSCLTIVAATGTHANSGFQGLPNISPSRFARQHTAKLLPDRHLVKPHARHVWADDHLQPWSIRAWTFQEAVCSRRILYLAHNTVRWACVQSRWSEESTSTECAKDYATLEQRKQQLTGPRLLLSGLPLFSELLSLINGYNVRKLTYPEDALLAFAGVGSRLSSDFVGGLLCGLPVLFFDLCLLWRPSRRRGPAKARVHLFQDSILPSWSWAAYETEITLPYTWMRNPDQTGPTPIATDSILPFYNISIQYGDDPTRRYDLPCSWLEHAQRARESVCRRGWQSRTGRSSTDGRLFGELFKARYFVHESDEHYHFWFPVPLNSDLSLAADLESSKPADASSPPLGSADNQKYLFFRTFRAFFRLGQTRRALTQILTENGEVAGTLYPHDELDLDYICATATFDSSRGGIELIAVLGTTIPDEDFDIWQDLASSLQNAKAQGQHRHQDERLYRARDVYNVLWVKQIAGIYYRKGTGIIDRDVWEAQVTTEIEVVLG